MSQMSMGTRIPPGKPPAKGSFPLDHFNECTEQKKLYMQCLGRHKFDNISCRYLSKEYLQCRMDNNLMKEETVESLGFLPDETNEKNHREFEKKVRREDTGFVAGLKAIQPYYDRGFFGQLFGKVERKIKKERRAERLEEAAKKLPPLLPIVSPNEQSPTSDVDRFD